MEAKAILSTEAARTAAITSIGTVNHHAAVHSAAQAGTTLEQAGTSAVPDGEAAESNAVLITLSVDAEEFLAADEVTDTPDETAEETQTGGPGKSRQSIAHRARAAFAFAEFAALSDLPFGKIVSALARFGNLESLLPPADPAGEAGETGEAGEVGETDEAGEGDGTAAAAPDADVSDAALDDGLLALQILQDPAESPA